MRFDDQAPTPAARPRSDRGFAPERWFGGIRPAAATPPGVDPAGGDVGPARPADRRPRGADRARAAGFFRSGGDPRDRRRVPPAAPAGPDRFGASGYRPEPDVRYRPDHGARPEDPVGPGGSVGPGGRRSGRRVSPGPLVALFAGLAVLGLCVGLGIGWLVSVADDPRTPVDQAASPTAPPTEASDGTEEGASSPIGSTAPQDDDLGAAPPIPLDATSDDEGLDFGYLTGVSRRDGTTELTFDRATYSTGENGDPVVENTNPRERRFELAADAWIAGTGRLLPEGGGQRQEMGADEFYRAARSALSTGEPVPVWLRHTDGLSGPVTALAEQYEP